MVYFLLSSVLVFVDCFLVGIMVFFGVLGSVVVRLVLIVFVLVIVFMCIGWVLFFSYRFCILLL